MTLVKEKPTTDLTVGPGAAQMESDLMFSTGIYAMEAGIISHKDFKVYKKAIHTSDDPTARKAHFEMQIKIAEYHGIKQGGITPARLNPDGFDQLNINIGKPDCYNQINCEYYPGEISFNAAPLLKVLLEDKPRARELADWLSYLHAIAKQLQSSKPDKESESREYFIGKLVEGLKEGLNSAAPDKIPSHISDKVRADLAAAFPETKVAEELPKQYCLSNRGFSIDLESNDGDCILIIHKPTAYAYDPTHEDEFEAVHMLNTLLVDYYPEEIAQALDDSIQAIVSYMAYSGREMTSIIEEKINLLRKFRNSIVAGYSNAVLTSTMF